MLVRGPAPPSHGGVCCLAAAWFWREDELRTLRVLLVAGGPVFFFAFCGLRHGHIKRFLAWKNSLNNV